MVGLSQYLGSDRASDPLTLLTREVVVHPKIQAHMVKNPKWLQYLAARLPEYAQYADPVQE